MSCQKKITKWMIRILLCLTLLLGCMPLTAYADELDYLDIKGDTSGSCGDDVNWKLLMSFGPENGTLWIYGTGEVTFDEVPWYHLKPYIKQVWISGPVTSLEPYSFYECINLESVVIECDTILPYNSFGFCESLETVTYGGPITSIGASAFSMCPNLSSLTLMEGVGKSTAFFNCASLLEDPDEAIKLVDEYGDDQNSYYSISKNTSNGTITIVGNYLSEADIDNIPAQVYTGNEIEPEITVSWEWKEISSSNYDVSYSNNTDAGTATVTVTGNEYLPGTLTKTFKIRQKEVDISWGATDNLIYTGDSLVPTATAENLADGDICTLTTEVVETTDGAGIDPGIWTAKVTALSNANYKLPESGEGVTTSFEIVNIRQISSSIVSPPVVSGADETMVDTEQNNQTGSTSPNTSDNTELGVWFALLLMGGAGVVSIIGYNCKRKAGSN